MYSRVIYQQLRCLERLDRRNFVKLTTNSIDLQAQDELEMSLKRGRWAWDSIIPSCLLFILRINFILEGSGSGMRYCKDKDVL